MGGSASSLPTAADLQKAAKNNDLVEAIKPVGAPDLTTVQPIAAFGSLGHEPKEIFRDMSSKIQLSLRCEDLAKIAPTFVVVYSKCMGDEHWKELGMSEVCHGNSRHPVFDPTFSLEFRAEVQCMLRFEVYRVRDEYCVEELLCQKFIGAAEAAVVDVMMARSQGNGWLTKELLNPKPKIDALPGRIAIWAEEETASKYVVSFVMVGKGLKSTDVWKRKADPYAVVHRTLSIPNAVSPELDDLDDDEDSEPGLKCTPVYHSEVQRRTNGPRFQRVELSSAQLCQNNNEQEILIELFDWFRVQRHHYMGESIITFSELHKAWRTSRPLEVPVCVREGPRIDGGGTLSSSPSGTKDTNRKNTSKDRTSSKLSRFSINSRKSSRGFGSSMGFGNFGSQDRTTTKDTRATNDSSNSKGSGSDTSNNRAVRRLCGRVVGSLSFQDVGVERRYSFLDYIRGGLELRLMVAIDFTRSNVGPHHPDSFHYMSGDRPSAYATAIRSVGDIMRSYSNTDKFTAFGFGAKIPPSHTICSNCFALTGDFFDAEVTGVEGVIRAYQRALHVARLHGPTRLSEVCRMGANYSAPYAEANTKNDNGVDMLYHVLLILTDGAIDDQIETISEVAKASDLPISIVVIGIGDEDFAFLEDLTAEVGAYRRMQEEAKPPAPARQDSSVSLSGGPGGQKNREQPLRGPTRNIVHFVKYADFRDKPRDLAAAALSELPREVCGYYTSRNVKPRGLETMEDDSGNPIPKVIPNTNAGRTKTGSKLPQNNSNAAKGGSKARGPANPGSRSRTPSMISGNGSNATEGNAPPSQKEQQRLKEEAQPQFVQDERARLMKEAQSLGYETNLIKRAFRNGIAANTLGCLVDNIVHAGYGKLPSYKEAAEQAIPDMEVTLPGQPFGMHVASMPVHGVASMPGGRVAVGQAPFAITMSEGFKRPSYKPAAAAVQQATPSQLGTDQTASGGIRAIQGAGAAGKERSTSTSRSSAPSVQEVPFLKHGTGSNGSGVDPMPSRSVSLTSVAKKPEAAAAADGDKKGKKSSPRSILVQSREGTKEVKRRFTKELRTSFILDEEDGTMFRAFVPREEDGAGSKEIVLHQSAVMPQEEAIVSARYSSTDSQEDSVPEPGETGEPAEEPGGGVGGATEELGVCGICLEAPVNTELQPCQHRVACESCATKLGVVCPLCQGTVTEVRKLS